MLSLKMFLLATCYPGLECLISHYADAANGLPTNLESFCRGQPPPDAVRKLGHTNLLHRAIDEGEH